MINKTKRIRINQFSTEEQDLYYGILLAHTVEDVLSRYYCDDATAYDVAQCAQDNLNNNDSYYEYYWESIDIAAIEAKLTERNNEE